MRLIPINKSRRNCNVIAQAGCRRQGRFIVIFKIRRNFSRCFRNSSSVRICYAPADQTTAVLWRGFQRKRAAAGEEAGQVNILCGTGNGTLVLTVRYKRDLDTFGKSRRNLNVLSQCFCQKTDWIARGFHVWTQTEDTCHVGNVCPACSICALLHSPARQLISFVRICCCGQRLTCVIVTSWRVIIAVFVWRRSVSRYDCCCSTCNCSWI